MASVQTDKEPVWGAPRYFIDKGPVTGAHIDCYAGVADLFATKLLAVHLPTSLAHNDDHNPVLSVLNASISHNSSDGYADIKRIQDKCQAEMRAPGSRRSGSLNGGKIRPVASVVFAWRKRVARAGEFMAECRRLEDVAPV